MTDTSILADTEQWHRRAPGWPAVAAPVRRRGPAVAAAEFLFCLVDLPAAIFFFTATVTLLAVGVGTVAIYLGLPILAAGLLLARAGGDLSRLLGVALLGLRLPGPGPIRVRRAGLWGRLLSVLGAPSCWRAVVFQVLDIVLAPTRFTVALTCYITGLSGLTYPLWRVWLPAQRAADGSWHRGAQWGPGHFADTPSMIAVTMVFGAVVFWMAPKAVRVLVTVDRAVMAALLGPTAS